MGDESQSAECTFQEVTDDNGITAPFTHDEELAHGLDNTVPGQPLILLEDRVSVTSFLHSDLSTERLEKMYFMLFLVSNKNNISPLHHQALKGRNILITERPDLHLVWYYDRVFIKPIPRYLLNHSFYQAHVLGTNSDHQIHQEASGFLRTYARLIVHESDYNVAKTSQLLPEDATWEKWCLFLDRFRHLKDTEVASRYHYGELRLTRLNFYSKIFFFGWNYFDVYHQYVEYFTRFLAPYLFIFGAISVILAAMQTALAADGDSVYKHSVYGFATFSITLTTAGLLFFPLLYIFFQVRELLMYIFFHQKSS